MEAQQWLTAQERQDAAVIVDDYSYQLHVCGARQASMLHLRYHEWSSSATTQEEDIGKSFTEVVIAMVSTWDGWISLECLRFA